MMKTAIIDIESNGLLSQMIDYSSFPYKLKEDSKLWVVSVTDMSTMTTKSLVKEEITKESIASILEGYDILVAHNGIKFDFLVLMLFGLIDYKIGYLGNKDILNGKEVRIIDTLILSRFINPDRFGGHSLDSWGERVGVHKTDYRGELIKLGVIEASLPKSEEFKFYHPLMKEYCEQDTRTNAYTYVELLKEYKGYDTAKMGLQIEHKLADLAVRRETLGFWFDKDLAVKNVEELTNLMQGIQERVNPLLPKKKLVQTDLKYYTPPAKQFKADGAFTSHMVNFIQKLGITKYSEQDKWFEYKGNLYELPYELPLETETEATVDDLDVVKHKLIELGWVPTEWRERDLTKDAKKNSIPLDKRDKAVEKYVQETLSGKYKEQRLEILNQDEDTLLSYLKREVRGNKPVKAPTSPSIRVGVTKDMCPSLVELGDKVSFAKDVADYFTFRHRKSAIAGGDTSNIDFDDDIPESGYLYQMREEDGRIPTPAIEIGASTNRYRHIGVANIPRASSLFGKEMRGMFGAGEGFIQFGFDYASLEARIEGHYIYNYDGGADMAVSLLAEKPNDIHCYSEDTEILTESGWKTFGELKTEEKVMQYTPETDSLEMVIPTEIVWEKYAGEMISIDSTNTSQLLTPNHRVLSFTKTGNSVVDYAKDFKPLSNRYFKTGSNYENKDGLCIEDDLLKLIVATQADGHLSKDCSAIVFSFVKESKADRLKRVLTPLGCEYSYSTSLRKNRLEHTIRVNSSNITLEVRKWLDENKNFTPKLLKLSSQQRLLLLSELGNWDGVVRGNGDIILDQTNEKSINILQAVCSTVGLKSKVNTYYKTTKYGHCTVHRIYISKKVNPKTELKKCKKSVVQYSGYIGCVVVPSSFILVRREGKVFISGNTKTAEKLEIKRDDAKSVNYAILYGASANKFVKMLGYTLSHAKQFVDNWWDLNSPLKELKADKDKEWIQSGKKFILSIDGRRINIRSQHSILNALFQSSGVICAKYITVMMFQEFEEQGFCIDVFKGKPDIAGMIEYHDENQLVTKPELMEFKVFNTEEEAKEFSSKWDGEQLGAVQEGKNGKFYITMPNVVSRTITKAISKVEEMFKMNVNLGYEYVTGRKLVRMPLIELKILINNRYMENKTFETQNEVLEYFEKLQLNKEPKKRESWGIFVNGERIRLSNGKVVWNQKNHASSAMKYEFAKNILPNWYRVNKKGLRYDSPEYNELYQEYKELYTRMEAIYENMKATGIIEFLPV